MPGFGRLWVLLLVILSMVTFGCRQTSPTQVKSDGSRLLKAGSITGPVSSWPQNASYLFQTEVEFRTWTQRYGPDVSIDEVDLSKHTVAILIRPYGPSEPMLKAVEVVDNTARIVLTGNPSKPNPIPGLPAGLEVRQYVVLQIPKVDAITVVEQKPGP